jgi:hypothetical protein
MALVHGKGTAVTIDGKDLSAYSNSVTFTREADSHDVTTFGSNSKKYRNGLKDSTATVEGFYDSLAVNGPGAVFRPLIGVSGTGVDFVYKPEGTGTGKPVATVSVFVTSYEESSAVDDMITFTAELQGSGDIADTTSP